jgi:hypothetical protein
MEDLKRKEQEVDRLRNKKRGRKQRLKEMEALVDTVKNEKF